MKTWKIFYENKTIQDTAKKYNLDVSKFSDKELRDGWEIEKEHDGGEGKDVDVVRSKGDLLKIVLAHLREDPHYYKKLKKTGL